MRHYVAKLCLLLTLSHFSITEWVEISKSQSQPIAEDVSYRRQLTVETPPKEKNREEDFTTPSNVWIEYQRERFGLSNSNSIVVHSTEMPPVNVDVAVVVTPKVETTSRRHSSHIDVADDVESVADTATEQNAGNDDTSLMPSVQGFLKFLKTMQKTWIKKSALSIENKIKLLKSLSDNLMKVIEQQFSVLWQPTERHRRKRRGLLDDSSLDFPPEAALMTINFLTFAVFLIKLVLQVVKIVKSKHYNFSGFNINAEVVRSP
ncbi:uncharacterized protein LOC117792995 [Drosophila innubila]|uniref:uncharacterized protein LOC117792995 n=1 Tax=Drosophila innubila TaxID=198719 RepID=UPI00148C56B6|nr:uncharacterized protein LOC117792995 [Drosophila innubila]